MVKHTRTQCHTSRRWRLMLNGVVVVVATSQHHKHVDMVIRVREREGLDAEREREIGDQRLCIIFVFIGCWLCGCKNMCCVSIYMKKTQLSHLRQTIIGIPQTGICFRSHQGCWVSHGIDQRDLMFTWLIWEITDNCKYTNSIQTHTNYRFFYPNNSCFTNSIKLLPIVTNRTPPYQRYFRSNFMIRYYLFNIYFTPIHLATIY